LRYEYGPLRAYIQNRDLRYCFEIDLDTGVYTAWRTNSYGNPAWIKPLIRTEPQERSGSTVHSHTETVDAKERKTLCGYTARRVITKNTYRRDSELTHESELDGWYIDAPAAWLNLNPPPKKGAFLTFHAVGSKRDDLKFTETGERETGFPLLVAGANRSYFRDQEGVMRSHESSHREEVTEFSEAPLESKVFIPPRDFIRVMQLPSVIRYSFSNRLRLRWEMLKDSYQLHKKLAL
jgi:hypothetical protein